MTTRAEEMLPPSTDDDGEVQKPHFAPIPGRALADHELQGIGLRALAMIAAHDRFGHGGGYFASSRMTARRLRCSSGHFSDELGKLEKRGYTRVVGQLRTGQSILRVVYTPDDRQAVVDPGRVPPDRAVFGPLPLRALEDVRLHRTELAVLAGIALHDWLAGRDGTLEDHRELAQCLGLDPSNFSAAATKLARSDYGYIESVAGAYDRRRRCLRVIYAREDRMFWRVPGEEGSLHQRNHARLWIPGAGWRAENSYGGGRAPADAVGDSYAPGVQMLDPMIILENGQPVDPATKTGPMISSIQEESKREIRGQRATARASHVAAPQALDDERKKNRGRGKIEAELIAKVGAERFMAAPSTLLEDVLGRVGDGSLNVPDAAAAIMAATVLPAAGAASADASPAGPDAPAPVPRIGTAELEAPAAECGETAPAPVPQVRGLRPSSRRRKCHVRRTISLPLHNLFPARKDWRIEISFGTRRREVAMQLEQEGHAVIGAFFAELEGGIEPKLAERRFKKAVTDLQGRVALIEGRPGPQLSFELPEPDVPVSRRA